MKILTFLAVGFIVAGAIASAKASTARQAGDITTAAYWQHDAALSLQSGLICAVLAVAWSLA